MHRIDNFNAGPAALPLPVLEQIQREITDYNYTGMSVFELSHRSDTYESIQAKTEARLRELLSIPDGYRVLFLQGGASLQFAMIPMNFLGRDQTAAYVLTGVWSEKAVKEAQQFGAVRCDEQAKAGGYRTIPAHLDVGLLEGAAYAHITSNNTIYGTQWSSFPKVNVPLIADMSSDILSRPIPVQDFSLIYAGAQKNLGPAGLTVVIVREELLAKANQHVPTMLDYNVHAKNNSMYNTPPTFSVYVMGLVLEWIAEQGGVTAIERQNAAKAASIYSVIDEHPEFYVGHAEVAARSAMNLTFRLRDEALEKKFLAEAKAKVFVGVKGHRSVGGCRVSLYNAVPAAAAHRFAEFMQAFARQHQ
ncbi:3-phosphoserine/phosphohydroxythreonine transaminase [Alicyclobacillus fodiniaquatilis]|uniref:Phosphoserine aminotransferase n=1 Tax=Alicyclobacillus fodiniaquatilis TaxID=1661150 RepID=A0ABW4JLS1_9BACL